MSIPPLRFGNNLESHISGEVIIHPSAILAPGVILQAAPNSKIIIGSGVCIGMGSILQVDEGTIEIEVGVNLGAGFLMVGKGKIGTNACIGAATTVFQSSVEPGQVVPACSILGDTSRQYPESVVTTEIIQPELTPDDSASTNAQDDENTEAGAEIVLSSSSVPTQNSQQSKLSTSSTKDIGTVIYGQGNIQKLLVTLFPHRKPLNESSSDENSD
ncbi:MAG: transferase [Rhizonema sp. PD38]|nr:transferase [Rhizonema sp. PD38]